MEPGINGRVESLAKNLYFPRATTAIYAALKSFSSSGKIIIPFTICLDPIFASHFANYQPVFVGVDGFQLALKKVIKMLDNDPEINAILLPFLYGYQIVYSAMKSFRPRNLLISEESYRLLELEYRRVYELFLESDSHEENWHNFYETVWNSDPRLFVPFLAQPFESVPSFKVKQLHWAELESRNKRHSELLDLFREYQGAALPSNSDSRRPIWRTTIRLPNSERNGLYNYLKSNGLFVSKWYKAMHRYVPSFLAQNNTDLKSAEIFEDEVINFKIDGTMNDRHFNLYIKAINNWISSR